MEGDWRWTRDEHRVDMVDEGWTQGRWRVGKERVEVGHRVDGGWTQGG